MAIALKANFADAYNNRGNALQGLNRQQEALESYSQAIALKPDFADAFYSRGVVLQELKLFQEALESYDKALEIMPDYEYLLGTIMHLSMQICDWSKFEDFYSWIQEKVGRGDNASNPFPLLALNDSPSLQRSAAEIWVNNKCPSTKSIYDTHKLPEHDRIRIGYFSADYHNHATAYLMAELFERHDKTKFELIAFSFGQDKNDEMRARVTAAFDRFIDVRELSDDDVAKLSRELEIDIAVDLKGFTKHCRTGIFAARAAPVQVNYLGYPGTMGADYIDYLIADPLLVPENCWQFYSEKIAYLPNSYQVNDAKREISVRQFTRKELGLPESGFVFCCFNNNYKITPRTFDVWMHILKQVEASVLWLYEDNPIAAGNLRKEAMNRDIAGERLIFAEHMPMSAHLARHRLADLFLDTLPYNAHTTASDALWAGLPVLTCLGETFASRVAASLLNAIHLPELITSTMEEYEALAIELATNSSRLGELKAKLAENRLTTPLFDIQLFTGHIEALYCELYSRNRSGSAPDHITRSI